MSNKIDGPGPAAMPPTPSRTESRTAAQAPTPQRPESNQPPEDSARIAVTDKALKMRRLEEHIRTMPPVDEARVDAVRQKLASGGYSVSAESVAEKLIRYEKDFA